MKPTAEEFLKTRGHLLHPEEVLIEFAKLHVTAALKQASENVKTIHHYSQSYEMVSQAIKTTQESILNSYNLDNIK